MRKQLRSTFGAWKITRRGLQHRGYRTYVIGIEDLAEADWEDHIAGKRSDFDLAGFHRALAEARRRFGIVVPEDTRPIHAVRVEKS